MIFWKIFCSEFTYQAGRIATWLYFAVLLGFTIGMKLLIATGDGVYPNNTVHITGMTVIGGLIWLVMGASVAGEAAARDVQQRIHPLIYTSPVSKLNYLGGKFLAACAINGLIILALPVGILLSFYFPGLAGKEQELLPFRPVAYMNVYFLIALPTVFTATALQFAFAALSRQVMASYLASLLLATLAQVIAGAAAALFSNQDIAILLDPVGLVGILYSELGTWSVTDKNTRLITLEGMFLLNRILWLGIAAGVLWFTYLRFSFTNPVAKSWLMRFRRKSRVPAETSSITSTIKVKPLLIPDVQRNFISATYFRQAFSVAWVSVRKIARNPIGFTLVAAVALVSVIFSDSILSEFGIPILPTTQQVLAYLAPPVQSIGSPWAVIPLLIIFFAGELIWHERNAGINEVIDTAPVPDCVLLTGKLLGLGFIIFAWMALLMAGGIMMQLSQGYDKLEIGLYVKVLFGIQFMNYLQFAMLAFALHVVINHKYIASLIVLLIFTYMAFPSTFNLEHNMLIYGAAPDWSYSDMRGFGATLGPWFWFKAYWVAWAILLAVAAKLFWVRGREQRLKQRLHFAKRRFIGLTLSIAIISTGFLLCLGGFIFYNTNVLNDYTTDSSILKRQAEYERHYGQHRNTLQPQLTGTKLRVELYPHSQEAHIRAAYTLVNNHSVAINSIHIGSVLGIAFSDVKFSRTAAAVVIDKELSYQIYKLEQPLKPGDTLQLNFNVKYKQQGFKHIADKPLVVTNGTYFTNFDMLPNIGYQRNREISDAATRKKYKLPVRPKIPSLYDEAARKKPFSTDQTTLETIIGTANDEVAVAPGALLKTWQKGNRSYFHYRTDGSIGGEYSILSSNYAVKEAKWNDVAIKIYYHLDHGQNINRMLQSVQASLEYYTKQFGPYPCRYITLVESAGGGSGANADIGIIYYGEQYALLKPDDSSEGFDLPYYIMAHEVSHQWWGMARLQPANVEGAGVLIEGLAVYSGMQVLEKSYGKGHLQKYVDFLHSSYALPRSLASNSLLQANEPFLYYKKGGLAMYALSKYIGKEKVNNSLRNLLKKHTAGKLPPPTTLDLYQELRKVTPDSLHYLLEDLFKKNTYWRLKTEQLTAGQTKAGKWEVKLKVKAQKVTVDNTGREKEVPMNDWLEVGLYEAEGSGKPLYHKMHRIKSGEQTIEIVVPRKPNCGGLDPRYLMIDVRLEDNIIQLD